MWGRDTSHPYGGDWWRVRRQVLAEEPWCPGYPTGVHDCRTCGARYDVACPHRERVRSTAVDHIRGVSRGGGHDRANLRGLCGTCNSRKAVAREGAIPPGQGWRGR